MCILIYVQLILGRNDKVKIVKDWNHSERAEEDQDRTKDPKQKRKCSVEESVSNSVKKEAFLQDLINIFRADQGHGVLWGVDKDVDLVDEPYGQGVAEE